jgi:histidinol-phosphate aminotransferase
MIGLVANAFIDPDDPVVLPRPSFFVFENFSARMGARPLHLDLLERDDYNWTDETVNRFRSCLQKHRPKIVWIASPNNPTGLAVPEGLIPDMVKEAARNECLVVVDEAYGEYIDPPGGVRSASSLLHSHNNLIVMRTFSKAYGLANLRLGYALAGDPDIRKALKLHSCNFPFGQLSLDIAAAALEHMEHLETTRRSIKARRESFLVALADLPGYRAVPSDCSILMFRHARLSSARLSGLLENEGVLTACIPGQGPVSEWYLRITLAGPDENQVLFDSLAGITQADQKGLSPLADRDCRTEPLWESGGDPV